MDYRAHGVIRDQWQYRESGMAVCGHFPKILQKKLVVDRQGSWLGAVRSEESDFIETGQQMERTGQALQPVPRPAYLGDGTHALNTGPIILLGFLPDFLSRLDAH